jgi:hypothetical protein
MTRPTTVDRLEVSISNLIIDPGLQPRIKGLDDEHVHLLEENEATWPPLSAVRQEDGRLVLVDGFHRLAAAQNLDLQEVRVEVIEPEAGTDLQAMAFDLNKRHGKPLSLADRRAEAARRLRAAPAISNLEVARATGLSPSTIATLRATLEEEEAIPATEQRVNRAGTTYTPVLPSRKPGELPDAGLGELVSCTVGRLFTSAERIEQRKVVAYLRRLSKALADQDDLDGWVSCEKVREACLLVLGEEKARALGEEIGPTASRVLAVAEALGFEQAAE